MAWPLLAAVAVFAVACGGDNDSTGPGNTTVTDSIQLPDTLIDGEGFIWDVYEEGQIDNGTYDSYDDGMELDIEGTNPTSLDSIALVYGDSAEWYLPMDTVAGVAATRRIYVSADDGYARYLEVLKNTTSSLIVVDVTIETNLGSDGGTVIIATSDFDTAFETTDAWIVTDDATDAGGGTSNDPTLTHVIQGPGASVPPDAVTSPTGNLTYTYNVPIPANGRAIIMHFAAQSENRTAAILKAGDISDLDGNTLNNMSSQDKADVVNFDLTP